MMSENEITIFDMFKAVIIMASAVAILLSPELMKKYKISQVKSATTQEASIQIK